MARLGSTSQGNPHLHRLHIPACGRHLPAPKRTAAVVSYDHIESGVRLSRGPRGQVGDRPTAGESTASELGAWEVIDRTRPVHPQLRLRREQDHG